VAPWLRLLVHRHDHPTPWDLSDQLVGFQQADRMAPPFSSWVATLKLPNRESLLSLLEGLSDDDWIEAHLSLEGPRGELVPLQLGPLDGARVAMQVDGTGAERWQLVLSGRGWAKVLTDTTVSTWQRLSNAGSGTGSIFSPAEASELSARLAAVVESGERISDLLAGLLRRLLRDQWALPASLASGFGPGTTLAEVMWPEGQPAVSTGGASEVDGVVWRGLSMIGGVRGTLWQLLTGFQNDPALVELWPSWVTTVDTPPRLRPTLIYRQRPFDAVAWAKLRSLPLSLDRVVSLDLGEGGFERFNVALVSPSIAGSDFESAVLATGSSDLPFVSTEERRGILRHGTRGWFLADSQSPPDVNPLEQASRLTRWLVEAYLDTPDLLNGSIGVVGEALPPIVVGNRLRLRDADGKDLLEFYAEGLDTRFDVGGRGERTLRQTLSVTRGRSVESRGEG